MSRFPRATVAALAITAALTTSALAGRLGLGREATREEVAAWDIDVRPDGQGLPRGHGTVAQGEEIFQAQCAACHGEFGEGKDRWPALAGGAGSL
ncbi:MAG: c-type cytochrome, partial [Solimonas sp.]